MATPWRLGPLVLLFVLIGLTPAAGQPSPAEHRAVWIDTFNTRLERPEDVRLAVARAAAMHANVLLVQVRRRGDAWYLDGEEPLAEGVVDGFDPLAELLAQARPLGLQVHAFLTLGAVWNQTRPPAAPTHVFNTHGLGSGRAPDGRANWLTRTRAPDGAGTSHDGYRFGNDFWLDPAHPDVADYLTDLVVRLAQRYPVDGVHLDGVRYPEVPGAAGALALSVGYNPTAIARYTARYGTSGDPAPEDGRFGDWRREQVTNLLQRLYVSLLAVRPSLVVSVSTSAAGPAPTTVGEFRSSQPHMRTFQNWEAWLGSGAVDLVYAEVFRPAHTSAGGEFGAWARWAQAAQQRRRVVMGLGAYLNAVEGIIQQIRAVRAAGPPAADGAAAGPTQPSSSAPPLAGVALYSLAANNAPVVSNPLSVPPGRDTPLRAIEDVASGLRTGRTTSGQVVDPMSGGPFAVIVAPPELPWKAHEGHVLGRLVDGRGEPVDGATVQVTRGGEPVAHALAVSDGTGVFALPALAPGTYRVTATWRDALYASSCELEVPAAAVARVTLTLDPARPALLDCR